MTMGHRKDIFRYRIITNLNCNMNESTGPNGNCYFCYQKMKAPLTLDIDKCRDTMRKIGVLKRATIMGGEAMLPASSCRRTEARPARGRTCSR